MSFHISLFFYSSFLFSDVKIFPSTILMWYSGSFPIFKFFPLFPTCLTSSDRTSLSLAFPLFFMGSEWKWRKVNHHHLAHWRPSIFTLLSVRTPRINQRGVGWDVWWAIFPIVKNILMQLNQTKQEPFPSSQKPNVK